MKGLRLTARARLTISFLLLFMCFGVVLLIVSYALLEQQLPTTAEVPTSAAATSSPAGSPALAESEAGTPTSDPMSSEPASEMVSSAVTVAVTQFREDALKTFLRVSALALLGLGALSGALAWWAAHRVLRPLREMSATARRISVTNLAERLPVSGPDDELRALGETVNDTFDRLGAAFAHERRLIANTSHELRTPVANQQALLEVTLADPTTPAERLREVCQTVLQQSYRNEALIDGMLRLAGSQQTDLVLERVCVDETVRDLLHATDVRALDVRLDLESTVITADRLLLERALSNVVTNAVRHNSGGGWIEILLASHELTVTNSCAPLDVDRLPALREPFRRGQTDRTRSEAGTGLGLAIVDTICERHDWALDLWLPSADRFRVVIDFGTPPANDGQTSP